MKILAIETSCDETAIAIADFSGPKQKPAVKILANIVSSQVKLHAKYGGVVPNLAKREHQKNLVPILLQALKEAGLLKKQTIQIASDRWLPVSKIKVEKILAREPELLKRFKKSILPLKTPPIYAIAVTYGPGLAPALWVGVNLARALAYIWKKPLIPVNHMAGHLYSSLLQPTTYKLQAIRFPALALLVSGGHTELVLVKGQGKFKVIGETLDDAAGEAFDKVARLLGFGYPGGPAIAEEAEKKSQTINYKLQTKSNLSLKLPRPMINSGDYNFSFSGLKTAVLYLVRDLGPKRTKQLRPLIVKEFQDAVVEVLVKKTIQAAKKYKIKTILLGGGVAANNLLRKRIVEEIKNNLQPTSYQLPALFMTGDNALMIALAAFFAGREKVWNKVQADANAQL